MLYDILDIRTLASANLALQTLLIVVASVAAYFARKRRLQTHCKVLRAAVPLQALSVLSMMLPALMGYFPLGRRGLLLAVEIPLHAALGVLVVLLFVYINLVLRGVFRTWGRLANTMRLALASWVIGFLIGLHVYVSQYL